MVVRSESRRCELRSRDVKIKQLKNFNCKVTVLTDARKCDIVIRSRDKITENTLQ